MNYRNRDLLDLACTLRIPGCCTGGAGEPAHANQAIFGKGMGMKSHDMFFASSCRACHRELDQGKNYSEEARQYYWLRGHVETMRQLWERGLLAVKAKAPSMVICIENGPAYAIDRSKKRRSKSRCTASSKTFPRSGRI